MISLIFVQGPPGTGKTFLTSRVIVDLISRGCKIGVTSNSHKAILNMLHRIVDHAMKENIVFRGAKKSSKDDTSQHFSSPMKKNLYISDLFKVDELIDGILISWLGLPGFLQMKGLIKRLII